MKGYKQLSLLEREKIFGWRKEKISFREIGRRLHRPHTTLTREFLRNAKYGKSYLPCVAQEKADKRSARQQGLHVFETLHGLLTNTLPLSVLTANIT